MKPFGPDWASGAGSVADLHFGCVRLRAAFGVTAVAVRALGMTGGRCLTFRTAIVAGRFDAAATFFVGALRIVFLSHGLFGFHTFEFGGARPFRREHVRLLPRGCVREWSPSIQARTRRPQQAIRFRA